MYAVFQGKPMKQTVSLDDIFKEPKSPYSDEELSMMADDSVDVTHYNHSGEAIGHTRNRETKPWVDSKKKANKKKNARKSKKANRKKKK